MTCYFFLAMTCVSVAKTLQFTFFLKNLGFDWRLPLLYAVTAILAIPVVLLYRVMARRYSHLSLASWSLLFFFVTLLGASPFLPGGSSWAHIIFFVWAGLFTLVLPTVGWIVSYRLFTTREGKRVFGILATGGTLGGAVGGYWTLIWTDRFGLGGLVIQILAVLALLQVVLLFVKESARPTRSEPQNPWFSGAPSTPPPEPSALRPVWRSPYVRSIAALVFAAGLVTTLVELQYFWFLEKQYPASAEDLTEFISGFLGTMFLVSGLLQLFVTGRVLDRFGVPAALMALPISLTAGSVATLFAPGFWSAVGLRAIDGTVRPSLHRTSVEVLFVPLPAQLAVTSKSFVDLVVFRGGDATGALLFLMVVSFGMTHAAALVAICAVGLLLTSWKTSVAYVQNLQSTVRRAAVMRRRLHLRDFRTAEMVEAQLKNAEGWRLRAVLVRLADGSEPAGPAPDSPPVDETMGSHISDLYQRRPPWLGAVERLRSHPDPDIGAAAFYALVRYDPRVYLRKLKKSLRPDRVPETVYLAYLANHVDAPDRLVTPEEALEWARLADNAQKTLLARIMGRSRNHAYLPTLAGWLDSPDLQLKRAAIEQIGNFRDPGFWRPLVAFLDSSRVRQAARSGLANYGDQAVDPLSDLLKDPKVDPAVKREIPLILGQIGSSRARAKVMMTLFWPDPVVSFRSLKVMNKTRAYRDLSYAEPSFLPVLMQWARQYYQAANVESLIPDAGGPPWRLLRKLCSERKSWSLEKIFRTLDLFLPRGEGYFSYVAFQDSRTIVRDNAVELIELRLRGEVKQAILPIFTEKNPRQLIGAGRKLFGFPSSRDEILRDALYQEDLLLRCVALAIIRQELWGQFTDDVRKLAGDENRMVRETAAWTLRALEDERDKTKM